MWCKAPEFIQNSCRPNPRYWLTVSQTVFSQRLYYVHFINRSNKYLLLFFLQNKGLKYNVDILEINSYKMHLFKYVLHFLDLYFDCICLSGYLIQQCWLFWPLGSYPAHDAVLSFLASDHIWIHYTKNALPLIENKIVLERKFAPWLEWSFFLIGCLSLEQLLVSTQQLRWHYCQFNCLGYCFFFRYWCCLDLIGFCTVLWNCASQFDQSKHTFSCCWSWDLCCWSGSVWGCNFIMILTKFTALFLLALK